jgi:hypothetical protein
MAPVKSPFKVLTKELLSMMYSLVKLTEVIGLFWIYVFERSR